MLNIFFDLLSKDWELITDKYNNNQIPNFVENRHDQIFGVSYQKIWGKIIENESYFDENVEKQYQYPFLSVRNYGHGKKDTLNLI